MVRVFSGELRKLERWTPYENCTAPSLLHFPYLGLPNGPEIVVLACLVLVYCFLGLTFLCTCYFLPALNSIAHSEFTLGEIKLFNYCSYIYLLYQHSLYQRETLGSLSIN